jgi:glycosyltransferase involved in cell wall biosynthesis
LRILNVVTHLDPVTGGGCVERTFQMSRYLVRAGVETAILTTDYGLTEPRRHEFGQIEVTALPCTLGRYFIPKPSWNKIGKLVAKADVVHLIGHWSILNTLVYIHLLRMKKPYVVCPAGALPITGRSKIIKKIYNSIIGKRIIRNANAGIATSKDEIQHFHSYGVDSDKIFHIPNGITDNETNEINVLPFLQKYSIDARPFILFLGRLNEIKGPDLLLEAFCEVIDVIQEYQLVFVGPDNGLLENLKRTVASYGAESRVHFLGFLDGNEKQQALHAADLLAIPSRQEAMSIVVLEAGIAGTPVLITDQCGFDEIEMINGGIVVPASKCGIKRGLLEVLRNSNELKRKGVNLKKHILDNYLWGTIINKYLKLYNNIIKMNNLK